MPADITLVNLNMLLYATVKRPTVSVTCLWAVFT